MFQRKTCNIKNTDLPWPYVVLCSGESNMARRDINIPWSTPDKLKVWNYDCLCGSDTAASDFSNPDTHIEKYAELYGASVASNNPELMVHIVNIRRGQSSLGCCRANQYVSCNT